MVDEVGTPWVWDEVVQAVLETAGPQALVLDRGAGDGTASNAVSPDRPPTTPEPVPEPDASADVVLVRFAGFDADDLARVVRRGGTFITEQVGHDENASARAALGLPFGRETWDAAEAVRQLVAAGWDVTDLDEARTPSTHRFRVTARRPG